MPGLTVVHVLEAVGHGTGRHLRDLVAHADGVRHVAVVPRRPTGRGETGPMSHAVRLRDLGATVHEIPLVRSPVHPNLVRAVAAVRRILAAESADVVHGHATVGGAVARLALVGGVGRRRPRPTVVYTPNGLHPSPGVRRVERLLARGTDLVIAVSDSEARLLAAQLPTAARILTIPNGIDLSPPPPATTDLRATLGLAGDTPLVGWVGRLAPQKAPEVMVAAAARLPARVHVALLGGGPLAAAVTAAIHRHDVADRVHLVGHVADAAALMPQFDVVALTSRWEGGPYVPLEAFRAGTPVVATDVVGSRDVVRHGVTGRLVAPDDPDVLAATLADLLDDPEERRRLVAGAGRLLRERHDVVAMARAIAEAYGRAGRP